MTRFDPNKHHRHSIRLKAYDYSQPGGYFITICTHERVSLFGEIEEEKMRLNIYGAVVSEEWQRTLTIRSNVQLDEFVVMPNHVHGIIVLIDDGRGESQFAPTMFKSPSGTIGAIVRSELHQVCLYGNAIITNTSSVTKKTCALFGSTSAITHYNGHETKKTLNEL